MATPKKKPAKPAGTSRFMLDGAGSRGEDILAHAKRLEREATGKAKTTKKK